MLGNMHVNLLGNMLGNIHVNMLGNMLGNMHVNMLGNMHVNKLDNMHVNLLGNMLGNMHVKTCMLTCWVTCMLTCWVICWVTYMLICWVTEADKIVHSVIVKSVLGKLRKKLKSSKNLAADPADNEDALKINICGDSSGAAPALNIHS